jgi:hypothetical protein
MTIMYDTVNSNDSCTWPVIYSNFPPEEGMWFACKVFVKMLVGRHMLIGMFVLYDMWFMKHGGGTSSEGATVGYCHLCDMCLDSSYRIHC